MGEVTVPMAPGLLSERDAAEDLNTDGERRRAVAGQGGVLAVVLVRRLQCPTRPAEDDD